MKFWELISAFRKERNILISTLGQTKWKKFRLYFNSFDQLVKLQNREILDMEIPFELAKEVCTKSELKFYLYSQDLPLLLRSSSKATNEKFELVSPLDILLKYGGRHIEEALEKGSSLVTPKGEVKS